MCGGNTHTLTAHTHIQLIRPINNWNCAHWNQNVDRKHTVNGMMSCNNLKNKKIGNEKKKKSEEREN